MITFTNGLDCVTLRIERGELIARHEYFEGDDFEIVHLRGESLIGIPLVADDYSSGCFSNGEDSIFYESKGWILYPKEGDPMVINEWTVGEMISVINGRECNCGSLEPVAHCTQANQFCG